MPNTLKFTLYILLFVLSARAQNSPPAQAQNSPPARAQNNPPSQAQNSPPSRAQNSPPSQAQNSPPAQAKFVKRTLATGLASPMELAISPGGIIYYTQLNGRLSMYNPLTGRSKLLHHFKVSKPRGTGLIGVAVDPRPAQRHIYVYYSPDIDTLRYDDSLHFNLSRFTLKNDSTLDPSSEKILLRVFVQRYGGAHYGGSLLFDSQHHLWLSTGDATLPFPANGYAPLDERGREYYNLDAQRSAANTNSLQGKILRIHPEADGSYSIPKGNLFEDDDPLTLPEIYVMGTRNPYRIAINRKTNTVYWGDIGPDAGKDSLRGPRGYDEFNQAKAPGNFGWPYFIANNIPYPKWDFSTNTAGPVPSARAPVNTSPNNSGLQFLPPAKPAMLWYPYEKSSAYPALGEGGRCAIAGDMYHYDPLSTSPYKFPPYYDGKLFVADWMRNWVMAIGFDTAETFQCIEPFLKDSGDFRRPIDMAFGKDGALYMLEYGAVYGADNPDARLVKIEYHPQRKAPPTTTKPVTAAPAPVRVTEHPGKKLMASSDCNACHQMSQKAVGPSYLAIAERYRNKNNRVNELAMKIINGGAGNWGKEAVMSAHPQISPSEARKIVEYILSLAPRS